MHPLALPPVLSLLPRSPAGIPTAWRSSWVLPGAEAPAAQMASLSPTGSKVSYGIFVAHRTGAASAVTVRGKSGLSP